MRTRTLAQVASFGRSELKQEEWRRERTRHYGVDLDAKLIVITKRRRVGTVPKDIEQLREKYAVVSN